MFPKLIVNLFVCLVLGSFARAESATPPPKGTALFTAGDGRYHTYRIPALATSKKGTLLAFSEARESQADHGNLDIVFRRSTDDGTTWSAQAVIRDNGIQQAGNPCPLVDFETGRIFLFHCISSQSEGEILAGKGSRDVMVMHSDDDGLTWSEARDISAMTKKDDWRWYAVGPCSGIQIRDGNHAGRLVVPANHSIHFNDDRPWEYRCHSLVSDDHGETWRIGSSSAAGGNETQIAEVAPDLLMQDVRMQTHREGCRAVRLSKDGGLTWSDLIHDKARPGPKCQGSLISVVAKDGKRTLFSSNPASETERKNLTVYRSRDGGKTWKIFALLTEGPSAYSDLTLTGDGHLACLYESGENAPYETIVFIKLEIILPLEIPADPRDSPEEGPRLDPPREGKSGEKS